MNHHSCAIYPRLVACLVLFSPYANAERIIYSTKSPEMTVSIVARDEKIFWQDGKGKQELTLVLEDNESKSASVGICGVLCGALMEGLAMKPSNASVPLRGEKNSVVHFDGEERAIRVVMRTKSFSLSQNEAKKMVEAVIGYLLVKDVNSDKSD